MYTPNNVPPGRVLPLYMGPAPDHHFSGGGPGLVQGFLPRPIEERFGFGPHFCYVRTRLSGAAQLEGD